MNSWIDLEVSLLLVFRSATDDRGAGGLFGARWPPSNSLCSSLRVMHAMRRRDLIRSHNRVGD